MHARTYPPPVLTGTPVPAPGIFGLHVATFPPKATFACQCGEYRQATGTGAVRALTAACHRHREACPLTDPRPYQHCGEPTRALSCPLNGYPAHPDCQTAWEARPAEQHRREHAAKAIAVREKQRHKARILREQLERQGYRPDVIDAIISGGIPPAPDSEAEDR